MNRRNFLSQTCLFAGAALLFDPTRFLFGASPTLQLDSAARTALKFIHTYSDHAVLQGGWVAAKLAGSTPATTKIVAKIDDISTLGAILGDARAAGIDNVYSNGNIVTLVIGTRIFEVQNLLSSDFQARLKELSTGQNVVFGHDAILFQQSTNTVTDPLRTGRTLRLTRRNKTVSTTLGDVLEGLIAAGEFGLTPDTAFQSQKNTLLASRLLNRANATETALIFLKDLSALASTLPANAVIQLLQSPLLTSAFAVSCGVQTSLIIGQFERFHSLSASTVSPAALWLASALAAGITDATFGGWTDHASSARTVASVTALGQAHLILKLYS